MPSTLTCSVRAAGPILVTLRTAGIDLGAVAERLSIAPEILADSDARLPVAQLLLPLWDYAAELLNDPLIGLHAAQHLSRETFDVFSYIVAAGPTFGEAAARAVRYFRLISDGGTYEIVRDGQDAWWHYQPASAAIAACQHDSIFALAAVVAHGRLWLDQSFGPREVRFPFAPVPNTEELEAFFAVPIQFGAKDCAFRFDAAHLDRRQTLADAQLAQFLELYAERALAALPVLGKLSGKVREVLARGLQDGMCSLEFVAGKLAMSERSLQRQLQAEQTTIKQLTESLRRELAQSYLMRPELSISDVAYMLGFAESAPFFRAFKKWTGMTPGDFRRGSGRPRATSKTP